MRLLSLFSGIGAFEKALANIGIDYQLVGFSEIDKWAIESYCALHGVEKSLNLGNISEINTGRLPSDVDIITHGSPCQDFSIAGTQQGGDKGSGTRSSLMWETISIIKHTQPKYVIWENVKGVLNKNNRHNFQLYLDTLEDMGYVNHWKVLNSKYFGVPQNRERVFVVSIHGDIPHSFSWEDISTNSDMPKLSHLLELYSMPTSDVDELTNFRLRSQRSDVITYEYQSMVNVRKYDVDVPALQRTLRHHKQHSGKTMRQIAQDTGAKVTTVEHWFRTDTSFSIPQPSQWMDLKRSIGISTSSFDRSVMTFECRPGVFDMANRIYHIDGIAPTITASGLYYITDGLSYRQLTPKEQVILMGFSSQDYDKMAQHVSDVQIKKQAGNSIVVPILESMFKVLFKQN